MPALVAGIHGLGSHNTLKTWMAGTSPAMMIFKPVQSTVRVAGSAHPQLVFKLTGLKSVKPTPSTALKKPFCHWPTV
jgi:hypothetical protein